MGISRDIHHEVSGRGIPFVFQHGLASSSNQPQSLMGTHDGIKVISVDCPGHGKSPLPTRVLPSFNYYADVIMETLGNLKIRSAVLGGISMGAGIALNIALRYPKMIRGLVLIRPAWMDKANPDNLRILTRAATCIRDQKLNSFLHDAVFTDIQRQLPPAAESILGVFGSHQRPEIPDVLENMVGDRPIGSLKELRKIEKPCLVIGTDHDPLHPVNMAEIIHQHIPGSQLHCVVSRYRDNELHIRQIRPLVTKFIATHEK